MSTDLIIHGMTQEQVEDLEGRFAYLTEGGWETPQWIKDLKLATKIETTHEPVPST